MKIGSTTKKLLAAVFLTAVGAVFYARFVSDHFVDEKVATSSANSDAALDSSESRVVNDDPSLEPLIFDDDANKASSAVTAGLSGDDRAPMTFFAELDEGDYQSAEYVHAREVAGELLRQLSSPGYSRNIIVKTDIAATSSFIDRVETTGVGDLARAYEVSPFPDVPCSLSTIRDTFPDLPPRLAGRLLGPEFAESTRQPSAYQIRSDCDDSTANVTIGINSEDDTIRVSIDSPPQGTFVVRRLGPTTYSLAYRFDVPPTGAH